MSDELRHNLYVQGASRAGARADARTPEPGRRERLGALLQGAREERGLSLTDVAGITNVRLSYLEALEGGRYAELPEEVYSKNFVRLYAQAVGLDPTRMLFIYTQERRGAAFSPPAALDLPQSEGRALPHLPWRGLGGLLATLLLVTGVVGGALWAFNTLLFPPVVVEQTAQEVAPAQPTPPPEAPAARTEGTPPPAGRADDTVLFSLRTTPPGAEVSLDGYPEGVTPIVDAPVRAGENRTVRVQLAGYRTFEGTFDLTEDLRRHIELTPLPARPAARTPPPAAPPSEAPRLEASRPAAPAAPQAAPTEPQVTITVDEKAWLEVYAGGVRNEGERLLYKNAEPGETFTFPLPVYLHTGNAGGVRVKVGNGPEEVFGARGAVTGRTISQP